MDNQLNNLTQEFTALEQRVVRDFPVYEKRLDEITKSIKDADLHYLEEIRLQGIRINDIKQKVDNVDIRVTEQGKMLAVLTMPTSEETVIYKKPIWKFW